jgi:hypothetical protein
MPQLTNLFCDRADSVPPFGSNPPLARASITLSIFLSTTAPENVRVRAIRKTGPGKYSRHKRPLPEKHHSDSPTNTMAVKPNRPCFRPQQPRVFPAHWRKKSPTPKVRLRHPATASCPTPRAKRRTHASASVPVATHAVNPLHSSLQHPDTVPGGAILIQLWPWFYEE